MKRLFFIAVILAVQIVSGTAYICAQNETIQKDYDAHTYYTYAERYYDYGYFDIAISYIDKLQTSQDATMRSSAYRLKALCHIEMGNLEAARKDVSDLLATDPYFSPSASDNPIFLNLVNTNKKTGGTTITTASQQAETLEEAPVPVTLITEEMIKACGARTLKEALIAYVPGMTDVATNDEMNIAMRGIFSSGQEKILILLDGHRLNSYSTNAASPDYSMSLEKIKQIEVLRGPASSIYGGAALTAVINVITKSNSDIDGFKIKASAGNYGQLMGDILFGKRYMGLNITAWGNIYNATGQKVYSDASEQKYSLIPTSGDIIIGGYNQQPSYDLGVKISYNGLGLTYNRRFAKTVSPMTLGLGFEPYSYDRYRKVNGNKPGNAVLSQFAELSYGGQKGRFSWLATAYLDTQTQQRYQVAGDTIPDLGDLSSIFPYFSDTVIRMARGGFQNIRWDEHTLGIKAQGNFEYHNAAHSKGNLLFGAEFYKFNLDDASYFEAVEYEYIIKDYIDEKMLFTGSESNTDIFLQAKHNWRERFFINAGMRYDHKNRGGININELSPRLAFIWNMPKLNLKLSYARAFVDAPYFYRNNTLDVQYGNDLTPEILSSVQLSLLSDRKLVRNLSLDANVCLNKASNFIVTDETTSSSINGGQISSISYEMAVYYTLPKLMLALNTTYQSVIKTSTYEVNGDIPYNIPAFQGNLIVNYNPISCLNIHGNANMTSNQTCKFTNVLTQDIELIGIPARCLLNVGASYTWKMLQFSFDIHNLLDTNYSQSGSTVAPIRQQGRWILGSVAVKI